MSRNRFAGAVALSIASLFGLIALCAAQDYPVKPIRVVVPFSPGGYADTTARILSQHLTERMGQQVVVENKPGAGTVLGADAVAKAKPDGYTLLYAGTSTFTTNPVVLPNLPYDPVKSFTPISMVTNSSLILVAHPSLPANNFLELVALLSAKPGHYSYGSFGNGTSSHFAGELLWSALGVKLVHVPYKGVAPMMTDLLSGQILISIDTVPFSAQYLRAGKIKPLALASATRSRFLPDVPTGAELGYAAFNLDAWLALVGPAGLPGEVHAKLREHTKQALATKSLQDAFAAMSVDAVGSTPEEFVALVKRDIERLRRIAREANIRSD